MKSQKDPIQLEEDLCLLINFILKTRSDMIK